MKNIYLFFLLLFLGCDDDPVIQTSVYGTWETKDYARLNKTFEFRRDQTYTSIVTEYSSDKKMQLIFSRTRTGTFEINDIYIIISYEGFLYINPVGDTLTSITYSYRLDEKLHLDQRIPFGCDHGCPSSYTKIAEPPPED